MRFCFIWFARLRLCVCFSPPCLLLCREGGLARELSHERAHRRGLERERARQHVLELEHELELARGLAHDLAHGPFARVWS